MSDMSGAPIGQLPIWHLDRTRSANYGQTRSIVAIAADELAARKLAASESLGEGDDAWYQSNTSCVRIGVADPGEAASVVCVDSLEG